MSILRMRNALALQMSAPSGSAPPPHTSPAHSVHLGLPRARRLEAQEQSSSVRARLPGATAREQRPARNNTVTDTEVKSHHTYILPYDVLRPIHAYVRPPQLSHWPLCTEFFSFDTKCMKRTGFDWDGSSASSSRHLHSRSVTPVLFLVLPLKRVKPDTDTT
ncbi:uncharacterized [Tachysurus ichikawai]